MTEPAATNNPTPTSPLPANAVAVARAAAELGLDIAVVSYPGGTRTAVEAAAAIGCDVAQIVKSLIFLVDDALTLALVSGAYQVREVTGFPIGGVPPFGHRQTLTVFIDPDLLVFAEVWAAAGTPHTVFGVSPQALLQATGAQPVALKRG